MGFRLSKIYTRTGDKGQTGLGDGSRIDKDDLRIEVIGTVDEVLSSLGLLIEYLPRNDSLTGLLQQIQHRLFDLGGEIAVPGRSVMTAELTLWLEEELDALNSQLPPLKEFILPGGSKAAAHGQMARALCRRLERLMTSLNRRDQLNPHSCTFVNRLSDLLFVVARVLARRDGGQEVIWQPLPKPQP